MKLSTLLHFVVVTSAILSYGRMGHAETLCPGIRALQPVDPKLSESEKVLLCGSSNSQDTNSQAWSEVPSSQAMIHLRAFLQSRGYQNPKIEFSENKIQFDPGSKVKVRDVQQIGAPNEFDISRKRLVKDNTLTPTLLTNLENWSQQELENFGYPCSRTAVAANPETGNLLLNVRSGPRSNFGAVIISPPEDLDPNVLSRYYPFEPDQQFNRSLLEVAEERIMAEGLVEKTSFIVECTSPERPLRHFSIAGEPRIWTFSAFASTEVIAELSAEWRRTRLGKHASYFEVGARASARVQEFTSYYQWYFSDPSSRASLRPLLTLRHQDEKPFRLTTQQAELLYTNQHDSQDGYGIFWKVGPSFQNYHVLRGPLKGMDAHSLSAHALIELRSHLHEIYRRNIYEGWMVQLSGGTQNESVGSDFTADTLQLDMEVLTNLTDKSPPALMGAWRLGAGAVSTPDFEKLPPTYRNYLGGIDSLRGFSRLELPRDKLGAKTRLNTSLELNSAYWSETIWPMIFVDVGWLGENTFSLSSSDYWSPGVGVNWRSPLGPIRATLANGVSEGRFRNETEDYNQWQLYLSLGERF